MRSPLALAVPAALALAGCQSLLGIDNLSLAPDGGAGDAPVDVDPARCLGGGLITVCPEPPPTTPFTVSASQMINTETDPRCLVQSSGGLDVCVILATSIDIAAAGALRAVGRRPLVLASTSAITVRGTIDVASLLQKVPGAGADSSLCMAGSMAGGMGAGGAGGSLGGKGGNGGNNGATPGPLMVLDHLQGGCPGSRGNGNMPAVGGSGGGAVYLVAKEQIVVDGTINASGAGGDATFGFNSSGGGGGGAGGLIGLDAPAISGGGTLFANGGGGGGGSSLTSGMPGTESPSATIAGQGGDGNGKGGNGSLGPVLDGQIGRDGQAGGGGGGGAGVVYVRGMFTVSGRISPDPRIN